MALAVVVETLAVRMPAEVSLNYGEGYTQLDAVRAARGEPIYRDPGEPPWTVHVYTPLYTALVAACLRLGAEGYAAGRWLGYGALLVTALLVGWSGRRRTGRAAWGVAALYLTLPLFVPWGAMVRPDNFAVLLAALGVLGVERLAGRRAVYWAVPLFLAAGLAKQSTVGGPSAALLFLAARDPGQALRFGALLAGATLAIVGLAQWLTDGWFWFHTVTSHAAKPFSWERAGAVQLEFLRLHAVPALAAAGLLAWSFSQRRLSIHALWLAASALATASAGKVGSDTNYFLESAAALAFLAANELPTGLARHPRAGVRAVCGVLAPAAAVLLGLWHLWLHVVNNDWIADADRQQARITARLASVSGPIVADDAGLLLALDRPLVLRPFIMTQLAEAGLWDETPVLRALEAGEIQRVVLRARPAQFRRVRYTPAMRAALGRHYREIARYDLHFEYAILAPRRGPR